MNKAAQGIFCLLLVLSLLLSPAGVAAQTPPPPERPVPVPAGELGALQPWPLAGWPGGSGPLPHALQAFSDPLVSVIVQFEGQPLGERVAERGPLAARDQRNYVAALRSRQADVLSRVQQAGGALIGQFTKAYNGVQVQVPASQLRALRAMSGVKAVHPVRTYYPALDHSTGIIRADEVWALDGGGYTGEGVTIAVIDTGIDYTHAAFGGPGTADAYTNNNKSILEPGTFPTAKVVGGWDFAGTAYTGGNTPVADPDPLDEHGHGTHVASTAAGLSAGAVAQGVAPGAKLYALKVFGASGSTGLVNLALEWCMDPNDDGNIEDRVDVVNLSLGGPFGTGDPADPEVDMIEQLAALGTVVVAASGNDGDVEYVTGSPASADSAISVAATTSSGDGDDQMAYFSSRGPRGFDSALKPEVAAPGTAIFAAARGTGNQGATMQGTSMATPHVTGVAALVRQAHPEWSPEQVKAALMNTAVDVGAEAPLMGAGRVDALRAVTTNTIAVGDPKLVSLSWGVVEFSEANYTTSKPVTILNSDHRKKTYDVTTAWGSGSEQTGASITTPGSVTIPAGSFYIFDVNLHLNAAEIDQGVTTTPGLEEYYGFVRLQNQTDPNDVLVVPFYFLPAPYNTMTIDAYAADETSASGTFDHSGPIPSDLSVHTVYIDDHKDPGLRRNADLNLVMMDYVTLDGEDYLQFGFNLFGLLHNPQPHLTEIDLVLDIDQDGTDDYVIYNYDEGWATGGDPVNRWVLIMADLETDEIDWGSDYYISTDFNSGTMFWYLPASLYELGPGNSTFDFWAISFDFEGDFDILSTHSVDYLQEPFATSLGTFAPNGDQDVAVEVTRYPAYNQPDGLALFNSRGKAGLGQVTFFPFDAEVYRLDTSASPGGAGTVSGGSGIHVAGDTISLTAQASPGYVFNHWTVNGVPQTGNPLEFNLTSHTTVTANFAERYTLHYDAELRGGAVTGDPAGEYAAGASVSLTAEPNPDYTFQHWLVNGVPVAANPLSIAINKNSMVVAIFTAEFTLAYDSNPSNGTITGSAPGTYEDGATIVLNAVPDEGYVLDKWMVNGVEHTANPLTFPLLANTTVSAGFVEAPEMVYLPLVLR